jgi:hypothetical protein
VGKGNGEVMVATGLVSLQKINWIGANFDMDMSYARMVLL